MIRGIHHTAISTGNLERALAFYRDLLGFEVASEFSWPAGTEVMDKITGLKDSSGRVATLKAGNAMIELFQYESPPPKQGDPNRPVNEHGITHTCLDVTDIDAEYERLQAAGVRFHCPPQEFGGVMKATYARDPDGNVIELLEILQPTSPIALDFE
jgi:catechol 2,3-dioxygenase-like lactoylglutathione lyase family enzyme